VIQYDGLVVVLQANFVALDTLECLSNTSNFTGVEYVNDSVVIIRWTGPDVVYDLETEVDRLNGKVILLYCTFMINFQSYYMIVLFWLEGVHHVCQYQTCLYLTVDGVTI